MIGLRYLEVGVEAVTTEGSSEDETEEWTMVEDSIEIGFVMDLAFIDINGVKTMSMIAGEVMTGKIITAL